MRLRPLLVSLGALTFGADAAAQAVTVIPAGYATAEANSGGVVAGFSARRREQILVSGGALQALVGQTITELSFRRDDSFGNAFDGSTSNLAVWLSPAARPTTMPSRRFADNRGPSPVLVFRGDVTLPATPAPPVPIPWSDPWLVRIPFAQGFDYQGGDLCIEIEGEPVNPPADFSWWVDHDHEADVATVAAFGVACGGATAESQKTALSWGRGGVPGSTFAIVTLGQPASPGVLFLGLPMAVPAPLDGLGATGCTLYVQPLVQLIGAFGVPAAGTQWAAWQVDLDVPTSPSLLAARFAVQGANVESNPVSNPAGITTTNALDITLGSIPSPGTLSMVRSETVGVGESFPEEGRIHVSRGPVIGLGH